MEKPAIKGIIRFVIVPVCVAMCHIHCEPPIFSGFSEDSSEICVILSRRSTQGDRFYVEL